MYVCILWIPRSRSTCTATGRRYGSVVPGREHYEYTCRRGQSWVGAGVAQYGNALVVVYSAIV